MEAVTSVETFILIVHITLALIIIGLVLVQQGKGADAGASFGGGASQSVFGSQGSSNFLSRATGVFALMFFLTSLALAFYAQVKAENVADVGVPTQILDVAPQSVNDSDIPVINTPELDSNNTGDEPAIEGS
jgi:preprotein translocase subunit SecG